jgi:hypothetical protein
MTMPLDFSDIITLETIAHFYRVVSRIPDMKNKSIEQLQIFAECSDSRTDRQTYVIQRKSLFFTNN